MADKILPQRVSGVSDTCSLLWLGKAMATLTVSVSDPGASTGVSGIHGFVSF